MTNKTPQHGAAKVDKEAAFLRFLRTTEIDARLLGMIAALVFIWASFHLYGQGFNDFGVFLTPRNLWNLSVQTASFGVMATGMVLVIVTHHIDLSVVSTLGFSAMSMGLGHPMIWIVTVIFGLLIGAAIGAFHGYLIAYPSIPAFIVTLRGFWSGAVRPFLLAQGETISPVYATFKHLGGRPYGAIDATGSWVIGILACVASVALLLSGRANASGFNFHCGRFGPNFS